MSTSCRTDQFTIFHLVSKEFYWSTGLLKIRHCSLVCCVYWPILPLVLHQSYFQFILFECGRYPKRTVFRKGLSQLYYLVIKNIWSSPNWWLHKWYNGCSSNNPVNPVADKGLSSYVQSWSESLKCIVLFMKTLCCFVLLRQFGNRVKKDWLNIFSYKNGINDVINDFILITSCWQQNI